MPLFQRNSFIAQHPCGCSHKHCGLKAEYSLCHRSTSQCYSVNAGKCGSPQLSGKARAAAHTVQGELRHSWSPGYEGYLRAISILLQCLFWSEVIWLLGVGLKTEHCHNLFFSRAVPSPDSFTMGSFKLKSQYSCVLGDSHFISAPRSVMNINCFTCFSWNNYCWSRRCQEVQADPMPWQWLSGLGCTLCSADLQPGSFDQVHKSCRGVYSSNTELIERPLN